jgi:predicted RNA-binding Zn-ribbon protein involved in translation (DUF1610 family)
MNDAALLEEANGLYWDSDLSVNQIADRLDVSKGRLYQMILPEATGLSCPLCGTDADYPNRTAKEKSKVLCSECGFEGSDADLVHPDAGPGDFGDQVAAATAQSWQPSWPPSRTSKRVFWGAVLIGAAAGIVLVRGRKDS